MEKAKPIPYENWPWWVKMVIKPSKKRIKPEKQIRSLIFAQIVIVIYLVFYFITPPDDADRHYKFFVLIVSAVVVALWQTLAALWIDKNSSWELINKSIFQRILSGILILILISIPVVITFLLR